MNLNGTEAERENFGSYSASEKAKRIHEAAYSTTKSRDFYYWMRHHERDIQISTIIRRMQGAHIILNPSKSSSWNKKRCIEAIEYVTRFKAR